MTFLLHTKTKSIFKSKVGVHSFILKNVLCQKKNTIISNSYSCGCFHSSLCFQSKWKFLWFKTAIFFNSWQQNKLNKQQILNIFLLAGYFPLKQFSFFFLLCSRFLSYQTQHVQEIVLKSSSQLPLEQTDLEAAIANWHFEYERTENV